MGNACTNCITGKLDSGEISTMKQLEELVGKDVLEMMNTAPELNPNMTQVPLNTWQQQGKLDVKVINRKNPIVFNENYYYGEEEGLIGHGTYYGQLRAKQAYGVGRFVYDRE